MKLTSIFSWNCSNLTPKLKLLHSTATLSLACVLLYAFMHSSSAPLMAQESNTQQSMETVDQDTTAQTATDQPERIEIRIEFPIVEPIFDVFYPREEPRIEADVIAPVANPLQQLPPNAQKTSQDELQAKRLVKPQVLLDRYRE